MKQKERDGFTHPWLQELISKDEIINLMNKINLTDKRKI